MTTATLSPARRRALAIVRDNPGIGPAEFARLVWPTSKGHTTRSRRHSTPAGGAVGAGIKMSAGAYLWRLRADGLVGQMSGNHGATTWYITDAGRRALETP